MSLNEEWAAMSDEKKARCTEMLAQILAELRKTTADLEATNAAWRAAFPPSIAGDVATSSSSTSATPPSTTATVPLAVVTQDVFPAAHLANSDNHEHEVDSKLTLVSSASLMASPTFTPSQEVPFATRIAPTEHPLETPIRCSTNGLALDTGFMKPLTVSWTSSTTSTTSTPTLDGSAATLIASSDQVLVTHSTCSTPGLYQMVGVRVPAPPFLAISVASTDTMLPQEVEQTIPAVTREQHHPAHTTCSTLGCYLDAMVVKPTTFPSVVPISSSMCFPPMGTILNVPQASMEQHVVIPINCPTWDHVCEMQVQLSISVQLATLTTSRTPSSLAINQRHESCIVNESYLARCNLQLTCAAPCHAEAVHTKLHYAVLRAADRILQDNTDSRHGRGCRQPKPPWLLYCAVSMHCQGLQQQSGPPFMDHCMGKYKLLLIPWLSFGINRVLASLSLWPPPECRQVVLQLCVNYSLVWSVRTLLVIMRCFRWNVWEKKWKYCNDAFEFLESSVQLNILLKFDQHRNQLDLLWLSVEQESKLHQDRSSLGISILRSSDLPYKHSDKNQPPYKHISFKYCPSEITMLQSHGEHLRFSSWSMRSAKELPLKFQPLIKHCKSDVSMQLKSQREIDGQLVQFKIWEVKLNERNNKLRISLHGANMNLNLRSNFRVSLFCVGLCGLLHTLGEVIHSTGHILLAMTKSENLIFSLTDHTAILEPWPPPVSDIPISSKYEVKCSKLLLPVYVSLTFDPSELSCSISRKTLHVATVIWSIEGILPGGCKILRTLQIYVTVSSCVEPSKGTFTPEHQIFLHMMRTNTLALKETQHNWCSSTKFILLECTSVVEQMLQVYDGMQGCAFVQITHSIECVHVPWDPGDLNLLRSLQPRLGDKPCFKRGSMSGTYRSWAGKWTWNERGPRLGFSAGQAAKLLNIKESPVAPRELSKDQTEEPGNRWRRAAARGELCSRLA